MLKVINNNIVTNKKAIKISKVFQVTFFPLKFVKIVFSFSLYELIISPLVIAESFIILAKYFQFLQIHLLRFQTHSFSHKWILLHSHGPLSLFHHRFELNFFHQIYIYIHMKDFLLMILLIYTCNRVGNTWRKIEIFCFIWNAYFTR